MCNFAGKLLVKIHILNYQNLSKLEFSKKIIILDHNTELATLFPEMDNSIFSNLINLLSFRAQKRLSSNLS